MAANKTVLLDGLWGRPRRYGALVRILAGQSMPAEVFHYNTSGVVRIETLAQRFIDDVRRRGEAVNVVAFSMGGLVVRMARLIDPALPIERAVFMNVPHNGTVMAYLVPLPGIWQMRIGSDMIRRLQAAPWDIPTLAIWCPGDLIVIPGSSARWTRATKTICCKMPAHLWPFHSRYLRGEVAAFLSGTKECVTESASSFLPSPGTPGEGEIRRRMSHTLGIKTGSKSGPLVACPSPPAAPGTESS